MLRTFATADLLLKEVGSSATLRGAAHARSVALLGIIGAAVYGSCMGTFSVDVQRWPMMLYSALKLPLLIAATSALCLPGFFVLNTALGLRSDIARALQAILLAQASVTLALGAMGPLILFVYTSQVTHDGALIINCLLFALATGIGHISMWRRYRALCADPERGPAVAPRAPNNFDASTAPAAEPISRSKSTLEIDFDLEIEIDARDRLRPRDRNRPRVRLRPRVRPRGRQTAAPFGRPLCYARS